MTSSTISIPKRKKRGFLPEDFQVKDWSTIKPFFENLLNREIHSKDDLKNWFLDRSELESVLSEDAGWRYIKMTCDTMDENSKNNFEFFITEIEPKIAPFTDLLNKKALKNPFIDQLKEEKGFEILIKTIEKDIKIFREENIPLNTQVQTKAQEFGVISGAMTVEVDGKECTLQQAAVHLQSPDRNIREEVYHKISQRRLQDKNKLNALYTDLIQLRHQIAQNAGFKNFRDYKFVALGRFDYSPKDCFQFHEAIAKEVVPMLNTLANERKEALQLDALRPWDKSVDTSGKPPLKPFKNDDDLVDKTIQCFTSLDPYLGECLRIMKAMKHLDLGSRKGKAPGGYNYPLAEIGVPFIFMNATSTLRDMITILHEGGHAVHSFLTRDLTIADFKHTPSEVAELASMSMELISMDYWHFFFESEEDLRRAKKEHLIQIIETLPWVAIIDKFQHWVYENPTHSEQQRKEAWNEIFDTFADSITSWDGLEDAKSHIWQKQLHLYEVPFYYIEYGIAQLGAIAVWKNYKENPEKGLNGYIEALKLGYMVSIPEIYAAANIKFDFSQAYIKSLMDFVKEELAKFS